jgi:putative oxidoreductase
MLFIGVEGKKMKTLIKKFLDLTAKLKDLPPLIFRLVLAYGFAEPAWLKITNIGPTAENFQSFGIPYPLLNAYMAGCTECLGVVLLTLGLATRLISIPLIIVMIVAIKTVHWQNGYSCSDGGFEIPFYYMCMLFFLHVNGGGKFSLDYLLCKRCHKTEDKK